MSLAQESNPSGMIWPDDVPPELTIAQNKPKLQVVDNKKPARKPAPKLTAVEAADAETEDVPADELPGGDEPGTAEPAARPRLAAVKEEPAETAAEPAKADPTAAPEDDDGDDDDDGRKLPPYLRVIK